MNAANWVSRYPVVAATLGVGVTGLVLVALGQPTASSWLVGGYAVAVAGWKAWAMVRDLARGNFGLDILAVTAIAATVLVGDHWAALIVVLMLTGGEALEDYATGRAHREVSALLDRAPRIAHRAAPDGTFVEVAVDEVDAGDLVDQQDPPQIPVARADVDGDVARRHSPLGWLVAGDGDEVGGAPDGGQASVDGGGHACGRGLLHPAGGRHGQVAVARSVHDGAGQDVAGECFGGGRDAEEVGCARAVGWFDHVDHRTPVGERAGLVHRDCADAGEGLHDPARLHDHAAAGGMAHPGEKGDRCCDQQRAGSCDHEYLREPDGVTR